MNESSKPRPRRPPAARPSARARVERSERSRRPRQRAAGTGSGTAAAQARSGHRAGARTAWFALAGSRDQRAIASRNTRVVIHEVRFRLVRSEMHRCEMQMAHDGLMGERRARLTSSSYCTQITVPPRGRARLRTVSKTGCETPSPYPTEIRMALRIIGMAPRGPRPPRPAPRSRSRSAVRLGVVLVER